MIRGVLLDLAGVVYVGGAALPGAIAAVERLRRAGLPLGFITNTTRSPKREIIARLTAMGLTVADSELTTPAQAARAWLHAMRRAPHLLIHPALAEDFQDLDDYPETAVVVGDAGAGFTYAAMNGAFRALMDGAGFLALARNRTFRDADGALSLDAGGFVAALEYASDRQAVVVGKPSPDFYAAAVAGLGVDAAQAVMVGDDIEADVSGALSAGLGAAILVRTGKYRDGAEAGAEPPPTAVVADLAEAADWILRNRG